MLLVTSLYRFYDYCQASLPFTYTDMLIGRYRESWFWVYSWTVLVYCIKKDTNMGEYYV